MSKLFSVATAFNGDISAWDVSKVTDMHAMFTNATTFNQNLSGWVTLTSSVIDNTGMFAGANAMQTSNRPW